jgi:YD repeat-containing protein
MAFITNQVAWADGLLPQDYNPNPQSQVVSAMEPQKAVETSVAEIFTTTDFLADTSPLSEPEKRSAQTLEQPAPKASIETTADGHSIHHVYAGESIQQAVDQALVGDTVYLHAGTYHESVTLKQGVNLKGEDSTTVILDGQGSFRDVILAQGNNVIEGVTVTGGTSYAGPKSAVRIEGSSVILRSSRVIDNADYGVYLRSGNNILIERVFFQNNHLAIQHPSTSATNVVIRYNTLVNNHIGINILSGVTPRIENNIITGSNFCAIYEFNWSSYASGQLSRGFALLENNVFSGNSWRPTAYGSSTPPAVDNSTAGNIQANPQFMDPANGNYAVSENSPAFERGAFLPAALNAALERASEINIANKIETIKENGLTTGYRILYAEGSHEEFYDHGAISLDQTPPEIVLSADRVFTNHSDYELVYTVEGVEKREMHHLTEGQNTVTLETADIFGNKTTKTVCVMLDQILPAGNLQINDGDEETDSRTVVLTINAHDNSPLRDVRFSTDGGANWTEWGEFSGMKVLMLPEGEGDKEVLCQLRDAAGNVASFSDKIRFVSGPLRPVVQFLSASSTNNPLYVLRYSINGIEQQETWQLQPGENRLMVCASAGASATFAEHAVILNSHDAALSPMPVTFSLSPGGISLTASNGLILQYEGERLVGIEKPGEFILLNPELNAFQELMGGVLVFNNGDKLLFQNGRAIYRENVSGEKTVYNGNGTVAYVLTAEGQKIRFAYQYDGSGKTIFIASFEEGVAGLYDEKGRPVWIKKSDGTEIFYEDGFLTRYLDPVGNEYHYEVSILNEGTALTGYRSELVSITPSGGTTTIPLETILTNLDYYPSIKGTLENEISRVMEYDDTGIMRRVVSSRGEILELRNGLPISLTDASGIMLTIQSQMSEDPDLFSLSLEGNGFEQVFDPQGNLSGIRLSDGTLLNVTSRNLDRITLADGGILSELVWDGQSLTGFRRLYMDGSVDLFRDSYLTEHIDPAGNRTLYILYKEPGKFPEHKPSEIHMTDGRIYKIIEFTNAQGTLERVNELVSMELPEGGRLEFENGAPVRYIQFKDVQLTAEAVPELPYGQGFIPSMEFSEMELRGITIDASGNILSGEILYRDGTQQLIRNGELYKQVTPDGQILEFDENFENTWAPSELVSSQPLTPEELAYRDRLIEKQLDFFRPGIGLHTLTGLPLDNYQGNGSDPADYSQSTLVGFWAEILVSIAAGDHMTSKKTQEEALQKLKDLLGHYRRAQLEAGWNGMLAFFSIVETQENILDDQGQPTGETRTVVHYQNRFDQYGFGDTLNLSVSLSTVIGALQGRSLNASLSAMRDSILSTANSILADQEAGYAAFYDPLQKKFHGAYAKDPQSGQWKFVKDFHIDRVFSEFRTGLIWLAAQYPQYRETIDHIDVAFRAYQRSDGEIVNNVAPWDGGAFQAFWPQIHVDETQYPEFAVALRNFLYTQAEFVKENGIAGFLSAGADPDQGYEGKIGIPYAAETDDPLHADIGSLYGLASAFSIAPHYVLQFFKNIETAIPGILTGAGWVDSIVFRDQTSVDPLTGAEIVTRSPVLATEYYGVDQASLMLSLLGTSREYFSAYLDQKGIKNSFDSLYQSFKFDLTPIVDELPRPPDFGISSGALYTGTVSQPDGAGYGLTKEPAFIASLFDPDYGEGRLYNYRTPSGAFHHTEIEFTASTGVVTSMGLQQFLLLPGRRDAARSLFEGIHFNLFDRASAQGAFYTRGFGFANGALTRVAGMGEVQQVQFDLQSVTKPVGIWAQFQAMDLSDFDFISIPVKLSSDLVAAIRLKFELKGMGEVFVTPQLTQEWQYLQIPVKKPSSPLNEIAVVVQSMDGGPVKGEFLLGPMSAFKVRISNNINWQSLTGKTAEELKNLLKSEALRQPGSGGLVTREEVLENFVIDSEGKLVSGTLRKANGEIQFYQRGQLTKWIFPNGRTVLFEKGLAAIVIDLARGQLEEARFYYDQDLRGTIHSFVIQENDRMRIFDVKGQLQSLTEGGVTVHFEEGVIASIETESATLTHILFADDQQILKAHVTMKNGVEFDIDQTREQSTVLGDGVEIFYMNGRITAIATEQNGRTELSYDYDALGRMIGVTVSFQEVGRSVRTVMSLAEFLQMPGRELEKTHLLKPDSIDLISVSSVGGYSVGPSVNWRLIEAQKEGGLFYNGAVCSEPACWNFSYGQNSPTIGMALYHPPLDLIDHDFLSVTIRLDPSVTWPQDFTLSIKDGYWARYSYAIEGLSNEYQTFVIPLAGKSWQTSQLTLEIHPGDRDPEAYGISGRVYLGDVSYYSVQMAAQPLWESQIGISSSMIHGLKLEVDDLSSVGTHIASGTALRYEPLAQYMDLPTYLKYQQETSGGSFQLENFTRFDGSQVDLEGQNVSRVILPDGTVNEYTVSGNESQGMIHDTASSNADTGMVQYSYGALRRITQADGRQYDLSYEFDAEGKEITVLKDVLSGEERRFKDGRLISSTDPEQLQTRYAYENGELIGAELMYRNTVLNSTQYSFSGSETQVTDDRGTTWFYDANGNLIKHMTQDGFLYENSEYTQPLMEGQTIDPDDYKSGLVGALGLRAVNLRGYQAPDGSWIYWEGTNDSEVHLCNGTQAVNLAFDAEQRIQSGQIQFPDGMILEIENFIPVRGRLANGQSFSYAIPGAER